MSDEELNNEVMDPTLLEPPDEAFNSDGSWKSHGHALYYSGQLPERLDKGEPNPFQFTEAEQYEEAVSGYKQKKIIQEAVKEVIPQTSAPSSQQPIIESPELRKEIDENERFAKLEESIVLLGEQKLDSENWHDPVVQREYSEKVHTWNQKNKRDVFLLPKEKIEWGQTESIRPSNMCLVEVPHEVASEVRRAVYQGQGGFGGRNKFESLWATLHSLGFSSGKTPTILFPSQGKKPGKKPVSADDRWGSQQAYETEWKKNHPKK